MESQVIVAIVIIAALVLLCVIAMFRYDSEHVVKVLSVFVGLFGVTIGSMGTYFFAKTEVSQARAQAAANAETAKRAESAFTRLTRAVDSKPDDVRIIDLKADPGYKAAVSGWASFDVVPKNALKDPGSKDGGG